MGTREASGIEISREIVLRVVNECGGIMSPTPVLPEGFLESRLLLLHTSPDFYEFLGRAHVAIRKVGESNFNGWTFPVFWAVIGPVYYAARGKFPSFREHNLRFLYETAEPERVARETLGFLFERHPEWHSLVAAALLTAKLPGGSDVPPALRHLALCMLAEVVQAVFPEASDGFTERLGKTLTLREEDFAYANAEFQRIVSERVITNLEWRKALARMCPYFDEVVSDEVHRFLRRRLDDEFVTQEELGEELVEIVALATILMAPAYHASGGKFPLLKGENLIREFTSGRLEDLERRLRDELAGWDPRWSRLFTMALSRNRVTTAPRQLVVAMGLTLLAALKSWSGVTLHEERLTGPWRRTKGFMIASGGVVNRSPLNEFLDRHGRKKKLLRRSLDGVPKGGPRVVIHAPSSASA